MDKPPTSPQVMYRPQNPPENVRWAEYKYSKDAMNTQAETWEWRVPNHNLPRIRSPYDP